MSMIGCISADAGGISQAAPAAARTQLIETSMLTAMSVHSSQKRLMAPDIAAMKGRGPIVALTAYHTHTAAIADRYCDFLLVGDSLGMVMHGYETTVPVPLELMIMHGRAVARGARHHGEHRQGDAALSHRGQLWARGRRHRPRLLSRRARHWRSRCPRSTIEAETSKRATDPRCLPKHLKNA